MKKFFLYIYTLIHHFFFGLKNADTISFSQTGGSDNNNDGGSIEIKDEEDSVYNDLLKGEVTQEVKELRHEMYFSERESHRYSYSGAGTAEKNTFEEKPKIDPHEDYTIGIIQENKEDTGSLYDNVFSDDFIDKYSKEYTIRIERGFTPRFRLEEYTEMLVVERGRYNIILDFYVPKYKQQFNNIHRIFLNEIEKIKNGDERSDMLYFDTVRFITSKAFGCDDLFLFTYMSPEFFECIENDSHYILSFKCVELNDGEDLTKEYFDEIADYKSKNHIAREKEATLDVTNIAKDIN